MVMFDQTVDLHPFIKLPFIIDFSSNDVRSDHWAYEVEELVLHYPHNLRSFFLNSVLIFKDIVYLTAWLRRPKRKSEGFRMKLVAIKPYYVGVEFARTKPIVSVDYPRVLEVVDGEIILMLYDTQLLDLEYNLENTEDRVFLLRLGVGSKAIIPPNWVYVVVNVGKSPAIIMEIHNEQQPRDVIERKKKHPPFYIVVRNEKPEAVKSPRFRFVSNYRYLDPGGIIRELAIARKTPVISQVLRSTRKFDWLFEQQEFDWYNLLLSYIIDEDED